jgi:hypothetical protein
MGLGDDALAIAGTIGCVVAVVHGVLVQRVLVQPLEQITLPRFGRSNKRLLAALLHFSTFNWFLSGIALVCGAFFFGPQAKVVTALLVGSGYLFGAVGNLWSVRRPHPGWILYGLAVLLIAYDLTLSLS